MNPSAVIGRHLCSQGWRSEMGVRWWLTIGNGFLWCRQGSTTLGWFQQTEMMEVFSLWAPLWPLFKIHIYSILCRLSKFFVTFVFCNICLSWNGNSKYISKGLAEHLNGLHQPLWKISHFRPGGICGVKRWTMKEILAHFKAEESSGSWGFEL